MEDTDQISALKSLYRNEKGSLLRKSMVKVYSDGLLGSTTAAMIEKYNVDLGIQPGNKGGVKYSAFIKRLLAGIKTRLYFDKTF